MKDKGHFIISLVKSLLRLAGCTVCMFTTNLIHLAIAFGLAEILGILEEVADKR